VKVEKDIEELAMLSKFGEKRGLLVTKLFTALQFGEVRR